MGWSELVRVQVHQAQGSCKRLCFILPVEESVGVSFLKKTGTEFVKFGEVPDQTVFS